MFTKSFVINLAFKTDRLESFMAHAPKCLGEIEIVRAIHGDSVKHPGWWTAGAGAWGCYRSHLQILERCYNEGVPSYLVFEDDAIFRPDFQERFSQCMATVPGDWQQIYLGGQLYHESQHPPQRVNDHWYLPFNVNRTHCFAVHQRGYEALYRHLNTVPFAKDEHIDHHLGRLHESGKFNVYCPAQWLVGQDGGKSNISGNNNGATYWVDPDKLAVANRTWQGRPVVPVFLESSHEVAVELERRGWHRGHWQNAERLDRGVCHALGSIDVKAGLTQWYKSVTPEAMRQGSACVCLFHPNLRWACVASLDCAKFHRVVAESVEDAERQLNVIHEIDSIRRAEDVSPLLTSSPIRSRNLIYHIWPRKGNGVWQWNVSELLKRIDQFDGARSIGIATSEDADSADEVQAAFAGTRIDNWLIVKNNPDLGEVTTFPNLLRTIPHDDSVTFYGHAKGVKYDDPKQTGEWTSMCYEVCLDDPAYVDASLEHYPVAGPFINTQPWGEIKHGWHFSGSFYWFRNSDVFSRPDWDQVQQFYWGTELWPGDHFTRAEAGALFGQECGRLYDPGELARMRSWLKEWREKKRPFADRELRCTNNGGDPLHLVRSEIQDSNHNGPAPFFAQSNPDPLIPIDPNVNSRNPEGSDPLFRQSQREPSISIVIPTLGRATLASLIQTLKSQLGTEDEIIVVADGDEAFARCQPFAEDIRYDQHSDPQSCYGNEQRNHGMSIAKCDFIWFCDDDDTVLSDALTKIRRGINHERRATMFRMEHQGHIIWESQELKPGNVSAQMLIVPNVSDLPRFPVPAVKPELSDNEWIRAVGEKLPIQWNESTIYRIQSHGLGRHAATGG